GAHANMSGIVDEVGARTRAAKDIRVGRLDLHVEYFDERLWIELGDLDGAREREIAQELPTAQRAVDHEPEHFELQVLELDRLGVEVGCERVESQTRASFSAPPPPPAP